MAFERITDGDLLGKGNLGRPDTPGVDTAEMQRILDELPREVIVPAFNRLAEQLEAQSAAAGLGAAVLHHVDHHTVMKTAVIIIRLGCLTGARTFYKGHLVYLLSCIHAHDLTDLGRHRSAAYRTGIHRSLAGRDGRRQSGTSRISAAAAVIAGQHTQDCFFFFIYFYRKLFVCQSKEDTDEQPSTAYNDRSQNNSCHTHAHLPPKSVPRIRRKRWPSVLKSRARWAFP